MVRDIDDIALEAVRARATGRSVVKGEVLAPRVLLEARGAVADRIRAGQARRAWRKAKQRTQE